MRTRLFTALASLSLVCLPTSSLAAIHALGSGTERPLSAPTDLSTGIVESDVAATVVLERRNHLTTSHVTVDVVDVGRVDDAADLSPELIPAGTRVDSILIHFDPVGSALPAASVTGSIQLDRRILGVIVEDGTHGASLSELGAPGTVYAPAGRQIELGSGDWIQLDQARTGLAFEVSAGSDIDEIRIISEGTPPSSHLAAFAELHTELDRVPTGVNESEYRINSVFLNGFPDHLVFITHANDLLPDPATSSPVPAAAPISYARYDVTAEDWRITRQSNFPDTRAHHVLVDEPGTKAFVHTADASNIVSNWTYIDHPDTNGNPDARILVSPAHVGADGPTIHAHFIGVWWDGGVGQWAIYNEDLAGMASGATFHVKVLEDDGSSFVLSAPAGVGVGGWGSVLIDHPALNDDPDAVPQVTHSWNGEGAAGVYLDTGFSVSYHEPTGRWRLIWPIDPPSGTLKFNVHVPQTASFAQRHTAESDLTSAFLTVLLNEDLELEQNPVVLYTPSVADGATANSNVTGVHFAGWGWILHNADLITPWPVGTETHVLRVPEGRDAFVHTAVSRTNDYNWTYLDHARTRERPEAMVFASQQVVDPDLDDAVVPAFNTEHLGVWYDSAAEDWTIFNQDYSTAMVVDSTYSVFVAPPDSAAFRHVAAAANSVGDATTLDHPMLNGQPDRDLIVTQVFTSETFTYNDHPIATDYDTTTGRWQIVNQDAATMPLGASFNVLPVPEPGVASGLAAGGLLLSRLARRRSRRA